jgi:hypothetical protein
MNQNSFSLHYFYFQAVYPTGNNGIQRNPTEGTPQYLAFNMHALVYPGRALTVSFFSTGVQIDTSPIKIRYHCGAPNMAGPHMCTIQGLHHAAVSIDTKQLFMSLCLLADTRCRQLW